ncbi:hypothetical protein TWF696_001327 [Orbilia brochopaga]|uniref:Uncharacterized protein n=1 Tax=Orbilia brochopaga TaxID=3140254 RepID=A0AAV9UAP2_9PEZI
MLFSLRVSLLLSLSLTPAFVHATNQDVFATITAAPDLTLAKALLPRQQDGSYACYWFSTIFAQCSSQGYNKAGGISGLPYCMCYPDRSYDPNKVDGYIEQCYNYGGAGDPSFASNFATFLGMCRSAGDIRGTLSAKFSACSAQSSVQEDCAAQGYGQRDGRYALAVCACYSSYLYRPELFDNLYSSCYSYIEAAETTLINQYWPLVGYCSSQGDIRQTMSEGSSQCSSVANVLSSCSRFSQFRTGSRTDKASFFCYDQNTRFIGATRDESAQICYSFATEYWPEMANSVSSYQYLCSLAGNVRAQSGSGGGGGGGGSGGGQDGVPSPGSSTSVAQATDSPNSALKANASPALITFLGTVCVALHQLL